MKIKKMRTVSSHFLNWLTLHVHTVNKVIEFENFFSNNAECRFTVFM